MQRRPLQQLAVVVHCARSGPQAGAEHWPPSQAAPEQHSADTLHDCPGAMQAEQRLPRHSLPEQQGACAEQAAPAAVHVSQNPPLHSAALQHWALATQFQPGRSQLGAQTFPTQSSPAQQVSPPAHDAPTSTQALQTLETHCSGAQHDSENRQVVPALRQTKPPSSPASALPASPGPDSGQPASATRNVAAATMLPRSAARSIRRR